MTKPLRNESMWFAVYTRSRSEKAVQRAMEIQKIRNYLPTVSKSRYHGTRLRQVEYPLIPGYIFTFISEQEYVSVLQTKNVIDFVRFGSELVPIPQAEIDVLRQVCGNTGYEVTASDQVFSRGDRVEVISGPLKGITGELKAIKGRKNLVVELKNIGCSLQIIQVETSHVRRLNGYGA